jgi:hypothetical protein
MFKKFWKAFDNLFEAMDEDLDEMHADNMKRMEALKNKVHPEGTTSETIHEEEIRPDGTRIKRTITTTRAVAVTNVKKKIE